MMLVARALVGVMALLAGAQPEAAEQRAHRQALDEQRQADDAEHQRHEQGPAGVVGRQREDEDPHICLCLCCYPFQLMLK